MTGTQGLTGLNAARSLKLTRDLPSMGASAAPKRASARKGAAR